MPTGAGPSAPTGGNATEFNHSNGPTCSLLRDVDAAVWMPEQDVEQLRHALAECGVVVLRNQALDAQQRIDFTARFGETESLPDPARVVAHRRHGTAGAGLSCCDPGCSMNWSAAVLHSTRIPRCFSSSDHAAANALTAAWVAPPTL